MLLTIIQPDYQWQPLPNYSSLIKRLYRIEIVESILHMFTCQQSSPNEKTHHLTLNSPTGEYQDNYPKQTAPSTLRRVPPNTQPLRAVMKYKARGEGN